MFGVDTVLIHWWHLLCCCSVSYYYKLNARLGKSRSH